MLPFLLSFAGRTGQGCPPLQSCRFLLTIMNPLFDVYLALDWSAQSSPSPAKPTKDALWLAEKCAEGVMPYQEKPEHYFRTRAECEAHLHSLLAYHLNAGRRVFLGVDYALGYPAGFAEAIGQRGETTAWWYVWETLAELVEEGERNRNNRFQVAALLNERAEQHLFWGGPKSVMTPYLRATLTRGGTDIPRWRITERVQKPLPQETWKLYGAGSVGGQTLLGIPFAYRIRTYPDFAPRAAVFPFEANAATLREHTGASLLIAEIFPSITPLPIDPALIRDQSQVRNTAEYFASLDAMGDFDALLTLPSFLTETERQTCEQEEGWIVGVRYGKEDFS